MKWLALLLPGGFLVLVAIALYEWHVARQNQPTMCEDWRKFMAQPVIIDGEERQPQLQRTGSRSGDVLNLVRKAE